MSPLVGSLRGSSHRLVTILGVQVFGPRVVADECIRGEPQDALDLWAHVDGGQILVGGVHVRHGRELFHQVAVAPLQLLELQLGLLPLRDVEEEPEDVLGFPRVVAHGGRGVAYPDHPSVVPHHAVLERERIAGSNAFDGLAVSALAIVRMDALRPFLARRTRRSPEEVVDLWAHEEVLEALVGRVDVRDDRELLDQGPVAVLDLGGPCLRLPLPGDVDDQADPVRRSPVGRADVHGFVPDPDHASARDDQAVLLEIRARPRIRRHVGELHPFAILRMDEGVPERARLGEALRR